MATAKRGSVNPAAQAEIPALHSKIEPDTIERVNDSLEEVAVQIASFSHAMGYFARLCDDDLSRSGLFFTLANGADAIYQQLDNLIRRLAPFEPLTVNHTVAQITEIIASRRGRAVQS